MKNKLILDYSKWRCGGNSVNKIGESGTEMLNEQGYMCCLGQFSLQLNKEIEMKDIYGTFGPSKLKAIPILNEPAQTIERIGMNPFENSYISQKAIVINDDEHTTPEQKIELLKELFATVDCEIEVINKP